MPGHQLLPWVDGFGRLLEVRFGFAGAPRDPSVDSCSRARVPRHFRQLRRSHILRKACGEWRHGLVSAPENLRLRPFGDCIRRTDEYAKRRRNRVLINFERLLELAQACLRQTPTVVLGSGASVPYGISGMPALARHLQGTRLPANCAAEADATCWARFTERVQSSDLETALMEVQVSPPVLSHIVQATWRYLNAEDLAVFTRVVADRQCLALTRLFEHFFRSTASEVHVVTPNYDRIAEYAAEAGGFTPYTGFGYGLIGARGGQPPPRVHIGNRIARTVNVWKVHGSFSWFVDALGVAVSLPPMSQPPDGFEPAIVTPGIEKFRRTHDEPFRTVMHLADDAMRSARAFLCVGFGFNDPHLQTLLAERCGRPEVPLVLLTKQISDPAHALFASGRCRSYLALEEHEGGTRAYCNEAPEGTEFPSRHLWSLDGFLEATT